MKYKGILLDFYGTCVAEDDEIIDRIISKIAAQSHAPPDEILKSWKFNEVCGVSFGPAFQSQKNIEISTLQAVLNQFQVDLNVLELSDELFKYWSRPRVYADTLEFLNQQEVPVIVVSNIDNFFLESAVREINFDFHDTVTSEDARAYKPRGEIFSLALERNGLKPDEVIHIGDSYSSDVLGAYRFGIDVAWVNRNSRIKHDGLASFEVATLSEIRWDIQSELSTPFRAPRSTP